MNKFTINNCKHAKELIKLDWPENLLIGPDDCETYLKHCETYNMKFLKGSYGTIVHKQFNKYFKYISLRNDKEYEIQQKLTCGKGLEGNYKVKGVNLDLDHVNLFQSKKYKDVYMVTSSPYNRLQTDGIKDYPYGAYIIHPNFLDYHGFIERFAFKMRHPLWDVNYAFTNATEEQLYEIGKQMMEDKSLEVFPVFLEVPRG